MRSKSSTKYEKNKKKFKTVAYGFAKKEKNSIKELTNKTKR